MKEITVFFQLSAPILKELVVKPRRIGERSNRIEKVEEETIVMIVTMRMNVLPKKRKELLQTVQALIGRTRNEKGCISCQCYNDVENENTFSLVGEWKTQVDVENHICADNFGVLLGAMNLLSEPPVIWLNKGGSTVGMSAIKAKRGQGASHQNREKGE